MEESKTNSILNVFSLISFSLVVFGILSLGFFVAPVVFKNVTPRPLAAETMTLIFNRFYPVAFFCSMIAVVSEITRLTIFKVEVLKSRLWIFRFFLIALVSILTAYSNFIITPRINEMRAAQQGPTLWTNEEFVSLHKRAESSGKAIFLFGVISLGMMVVRKK